MDILRNAGGIYFSTCVPVFSTNVCMFHILSAKCTSVGRILICCVSGKIIIFPNIPHVSAKSFIIWINVFACFSIKLHPQPAVQPNSCRSCSDSQFHGLTEIWLALHRRSIIPLKSGWRFTAGITPHNSDNCFLFVVGLEFVLGSTCIYISIKCQEVSTMICLGTFGKTYQSYPTLN